MSTAKSGLELLAGRLHVYVSQSNARFEVGDSHLNSITIMPPQATIGRGEEADFRLGGSASANVSRCHLMVRTAGRQWTATDCGSTNCTFEPEENRSAWRQIASDSPIPLHSGMHLCLGPDLMLRFEIERDPLSGQTTDRKSAQPTLGAQRIRPVELEETARALLARRRADSRDLSVPSAEEVAEALFIGRSTAYRRMGELRDLKEIKGQLDGDSTDRRALADAVAISFPYLLAPSVE